MIFINPNSDKIISAREYHVEQLTKLLKNRVRRLKLEDGQMSFLLEKIIPSCKEILGGVPGEIKKLSEKLVLTRSEEQAVKRLFNYSDWFCEKKEKRYNAHVLAGRLDINTCVYCNRNYINTVIGITRSQFDHYFSKRSYPLLALSFYNLIPSCSICNSTFKSKNELFLNEHLHPYVDDCLKEFRFSYSYDTKMKDSLAVKLKYLKEGSKAKKTFEFFKIKEVYNAHTEELRDLIRMREVFSDKYLRILSTKTLFGTKISKSELYQLAFGVYLQENQFSKRPFSKFKKDILTEIGIIK